MLEGNVVLVTGAGRGFGWGIARAMAQAGAKVCVTDINEDDVARSVQDIEHDGKTAIGRYLEVTDLDAFMSVVDELVVHWGRIDVLVHNAIYMPLISFEDTTPESWWKQLDVSLGGLYNGTRAVWKYMKAQRHGHIIGIASGSSLRGYQNEVTYCTGKHGQEGFVKALALEAHPYNIAINTIGPGKPIKPTRLTWEELEQLSAEEKAGWADPVELGKAFAWLASQSPSRFSGLRFDAGPIIDTIAAEGYDFTFEPEKATLYPDDFRARLHWFENYSE